MKIQDLLFLTAIVLLLLFKKGKYTWHAGMFCFVLSGILFLIGNLFTAQRLTWYGAAFITIYCMRAIYAKA